MKHKARGFTIVELLIVVVIIAILASITMVAYNGITKRANDAKRQADISNARKLVEAYYALNGSYPVTTATISSPGSVRTDENCTFGTKTSDWIPGITERLPQSVKNTGLVNSQAKPGCYTYASDGQQYIISAWGNIDSGPQKTTMYRRLGFREIAGTNMDTATAMYYCNHVAIGGGSSYKAKSDYYKYSYTVSNITSCNETPPTGA